MATWDFTDHKAYPGFAALSGVAFVEQGRFNPFPLLVANDVSLADLGGRRAGPVPMARFRPNIVLEGAGVYEEDDWREVRIGSVRLGVSIPCERCPMVNVDPDTAESSKQTLATLASYRRLEKGLSTKVPFGVYAAVAEPGRVSCGDEAQAR